MARPILVLPISDPPDGATMSATGATSCHSHQTCDTVRADGDTPQHHTSGRLARPRGPLHPDLTLSTSASSGVGMFDAFIINRIRRERQQEQERRIPLHIEAPRRREPPAHERRRGSEREQESNRGVVIVDYSI